MFHKKYIALLLAVLVALFFRFHNLSSVPPSASLDEVSIGYNAYSILKTGADEYGTKFPILLRAYDDWRPALYVYLVIPFIKIFGLTTIAVRLPAVILSIIAGIALYLLTKEIFPNARKISTFGMDFSISEIVFFLYAISPWNIYLSRLGHEVNAAFSFLIIGVFFFFRFVFHEKKWSLLFSSIFLALSFDAYQSTKIVIPFLLFFLFLLFYKKLFKHLKTTLSSAVIGAIIILPVVYVSGTNSNALVRFEATNVLNSSQEKFQESAKRLIEHKENNNYLGLILDNRRVVGASIIFNAYISHFNPVWLVFNKGEEPFKIPDTGIISPFGLALLVFGLLMTRKILDRKLYFFFIVWILLGIIPGAITNGFPHAMRIYNSFPAMLIFEGAGFYFLILSIGKIQRKAVAKFLYLLIVLISIIWIVDFYNKYFIRFPKELSNQFQYGVIQAFDYAKNIEGDFEKVIVSNNDNLYQSYMFYLYASKYDPQEYQKLGGTISGGYDKEHKIGKYEFRPIHWEEEAEVGNILYVGNVTDFLTSVHSIKQFSNKDGTTVMKIVTK